MSIEKIHFQDNKKFIVEILLAFENKSTRPNIEHLQLLRYKLNLPRHQRRKKETLAPVIALIFNHSEVRFERRLIGKTKKIFPYAGEYYDDPPKIEKTQIA